MTLPKRSTPESFTLTPPPAVIPPPPPAVIPPPPLDPVPTFDAINFRATDGGVWRVKVTPMGTLLLDRVVT